MSRCSKAIKFGRPASAGSGELRSKAGLLIASKCSSSNRTGISQNSFVACEESLMTALVFMLQHGITVSRQAAPTLTFSGLVLIFRWRRHAGLLRLAPEPLAESFVLAVEPQPREELRQFFFH